MPIRKFIPDKILEFPTVSQFVDVIERLTEYKHEKMSQGLRSLNVATSVNKTWLISLLQEYGIKEFPYSIPLEVLLQFSLNIHTIMNLRGSKRGIQLYCSVLSLGEVIVDDSKFIKDSDLFMLNSKNQGVIVGDTLDPQLYLASDSEEINSLQELGITIKSRYFDGTTQEEEYAIRQYIEKSLPAYLGFSPNKQITYHYLERADFIYDPLLNNYFV